MRIDLTNTCPFQSQRSSLEVVSTKFQQYNREANIQGIDNLVKELKALSTERMSEQELVRTKHDLANLIHLHKIIRLTEELPKTIKELLDIWNLICEKLGYPKAIHNITFILCYG